MINKIILIRYFMKNNQGMAMIAVVLIILGAIVVGGGIGAGVYYSQKKSQQKTGSIESNAAVSGNAGQNNPVVPGSGTGQSVTNTNPVGVNAGTASMPDSTDGDGTNTNTDIKTGDTSKSEAEKEKEEQCEHIAIGGVWTLTTDLEGATFTPPYAKTAMKFQFNEDGSVNFTEQYNSEGTTASAQHVGSWQRQGCNFVYNGIAKGSGTDEDVGFFTFTFKITAGGELSPSDVGIKGDWVSNETYVAADGTTTKQTITGEWVAKKLSE